MIDLQHIEALLQLMTQYQADSIECIPEGGVRITKSKHIPQPKVKTDKEILDAHEKPSPIRKRDQMQERADNWALTGKIV